MTTASGSRDRSIQFLRSVVSTEGGSGVESEAFVPGARAWAKVFFGTGSERREAAAAGGVQTATFRCLSNSALRAVTRRDRILFEGTEWGISAISQVASQGHELEFTAMVRKE